MARLMRDPALLVCHRAMLPPPRLRGQGALDISLVVGMAKLAEADSMSDAIASLSVAETAAVLGNDDGITGLLRLTAAANGG
jgi:membrane glycosyltransferase